MWFTDLLLSTLVAIVRRETKISLKSTVSINKSMIIAQEKKKKAVYLFAS